MYIPKINWINIKVIFNCFAFPKIEIKSTVMETEPVFAGLPG